MWNGGFERERLRGWGFDWQVRQAWGVEVSLDRFAAASGRQSLRLSFNSFPTLDFYGVYQRVAVEPGSAYHLRTMAKALDFTTQSGLKLQVVTHDGEQVLGETAAIAGTTADWVPLEAHVQVPADITLVVLRVRREPAPAPKAIWAAKYGSMTSRSHRWEERRDDQPGASPSTPPHVGCPSGAAIDGPAAGQR